MDAKLTLKLNKNIIEKARDYASARNESLSRLVEKYFAEITSSRDFKQSLAPKTRSLSGILKNKNINYKDNVTNYLLEKYRKNEKD